MDNKKIQIKYIQQQYYKNKYKKEKAIKDITLNISNGDIYTKIIDNVIHRHNDFLKNNNVTIDVSPMKLLGCTKQKFIEYLTKKLKENMTLENYGEWQIDHIYPISKINFSDIEQIKKYLNYTNLQPLNKIENIKKSNKIVEFNNKKA